MVLYSSIPALFEPTSLSPSRWWRGGAIAGKIYTETFSLRSFVFVGNVQYSTVLVG